MGRRRSDPWIHPQCTWHPGRALSAIQRAWSRREANRLATEGWTPRLLKAAGWVLAVALLIPLMDRMFLWWLPGPESMYPAAMEGLLLRSGIVVIGWVAIDLYTALIRAGDRDVLAIWPVEPAEVVRFEVRRLASQRAILIVVYAVLTAPIAMYSPYWWFLGLAHTSITWLLAVSVSTMVMLLAIEVSEHPLAAPWLDLIRGNNHRAQAAFLYAPGAVLLGCGLLVQFSAVGVSMLGQGRNAGAIWLLLPLPFAVAAWLPVSRLSRRWFRAGTVLAEIDARYAQLEDREDALRVYLDWAVRFLPKAAGLYALKDLRHGWRARRTWVMGAWLIGLAGLVAAWTADPTGPGRSAAVAVIGCWIVAVVGVLLEADEPDFLVAWLPPGGPSKWLGRGATLWAWMQPCIWLGAMASGVRHGIMALLVVLIAGQGTAVMAAATAMFTGRRGGLPLYGPVAAVCAGLVVMGVL